MDELRCKDYVAIKSYYMSSLWDWDGDVVAEVGEKILKSIIKRQIAFLIGGIHYRCNNDILLRFFVYPRSEQCHLVDYFIRRQ